MRSTVKCPEATRNRQHTGVSALGKAQQDLNHYWVHLITICVGCPRGFLGVLPRLFPFAFIRAGEKAARELQSEEQGSPVVTWMLFRNPERGEAEWGSWKSLSQDQARSPY